MSSDSGNTHIRSSQQSCDEDNDHLELSVKGGENNSHNNQNHNNSTDKKNSSLTRSIFEMNSFGDSFNSQRMKEILSMDKIDELLETRSHALRVR